MSAFVTVEEYVQAMVGDFQPQHARGLNIVYHFQITGSEGGSWTVTIADQKCTAQQGPPSQADTHIILDYDTFREFTAGQLNVEQAFMQGRLKVNGDMGYALKLIDLFSPPDTPASSADASFANDNSATNNFEPKKGKYSMSNKIAADKIIRKHIIWAMGGGLIPVPLVDFSAVTAVQMDMLSQLAKLYEVDYDVTTGKTFVAALTGTTLATIGASLVKIIPGVGTVLGGVSMSVMSGASTYAVGQVATQHFESGGNLLDVDFDKAKKSYKKAFEEGKGVVSDLEKEQDEGNDVFEKLEKLGKLKEQGVINEEEFETQKQKLLERI